MIAEAKHEGRTDRSASLMDLCHLKSSELEPQFQSTKVELYFEVTLEKMIQDCIVCSIHNEQGSSASQMTAAKVTNIISRLPGCAGQAADAVSAYTQVKMEDAPSMLKIPKSECPDIWILLPKHTWSIMEDPVVPLERNLYGHPQAGLLWERQFEKVLLETRLGISSKLGMLIRQPRKKGLFVSVFVDDKKLGWKETEHRPNVESTYERSRFGRTNILP